MTETASGTETMDLNMDAGMAEAAKRPSFIARALKKLLSWTITLVFCVGFYMLISSLQGEQKQEFFEEARQQAAFACGADSACLEKVQTHFGACIEDNYSSYKKGKYSRRYVFDLDGFQACLATK